MNPKNHALMVKLMNINVETKHQEDVKEYNRIQIDPYSIIGVKMTYGNDGNIHDQYKSGLKTGPNSEQRWDKNIDKAFDLSVQSKGSYNRKMLIQILQCMSADSVRIEMEGSDSRLKITAQYKGENSTAECVLMPIIDTRDD